MLKHGEYGLVSFLEMFQTDQFLRLLLGNARSGTSFHGSTVVSQENLNAGVVTDEVRAVDKHVVRVGFGNDNPKTRWRFDFRGTTLEVNFDSWLPGTPFESCSIQTITLAADSEQQVGVAWVGADNHPKASLL
jgi:hypothetical protein